MTIRVSVGDNTRAAALFLQLAQEAATGSSASQQAAAEQVTIAVQQAERAEDEADRAGMEADRSTNAAMEVVAPIKASLSTPQAGEAGVATLAAGTRSFDDKLVADASIAGPGRITGFDTWCFVEGGRIEFVLYRDNGNGTFSEVGRRTEATTGEGAACSIVFDVPLEFGDYPVRTAYRQIDPNALSAIEEPGNFKIAGPNDFPAAFANADTAASPVRAMVQTRYEQDVQTVTAPAVAGLSDRVDAIETALKPDPLAVPDQTPIQTRRLRRGAFDGGPRQFAAVDPIGFSTSAVGENTFTLTGQGVNVYERDSAMIRFIGGRWILGQSYPGGLFRYNRSFSFPVTGEMVMNQGRNPIVEVVVTGDALEFRTQGFDQPMLVAIDGEFTSFAGYTTPATNALQWVRLDFPQALIGKRVRLLFPPDTAVGAFRVRGTLSDPTPAYDLSAGFMGDSLTEGSNSTEPHRDSWGSIAAARLGIKNYVLGGIGGTGYVRRQGDRPNFLERVEDILTMVDGGPPDAAIIAGGINDYYDTPEQKAAFEANALALFQQLRAGAPDMRIVVVGPLAAKTGYDDAMRGKRDALFAARAQVENVDTVDIEDIFEIPEWPTWFGLAPNGTVDDTHTLDPGHAWMGEVIPQRIKPLW
ncbi:SGNH/GDSL hydrolase family protein [Croceicoccus sp. YJ47]|uniref:SGNH/GDSL hydrolase family protein n=1 Tax=Croceicoccus sp. YJ47 TaxID=2798724 RepID=UPI0019226866|nr:SGNH/GDSL hydrolase family protein [Croceicoccus sp. YJ47]QQN73882.1 SGNH/GDSL hydrolase family protein [Croceicoccus sp. YJ47]